MTAKSERHFYVIAGELSGDKLGAELVQSLKKEVPNLKLSGIAGPQMQAQGIESLFAMDDLSVMGLVEILPRIPRLLKRVSQTARDILSKEIDAIITIDSPDFCFRVLKQVKKERPDIPVIHYVAPSVWAWRPERADKMAKYVDHVLALLPFEPPYMHRAGMSCDFVGHPAAFEPSPAKSDLSALKSELKLEGRKKCIALLPGSRKGEVARMLPIFKSALDGREDLRIVIPVAYGREAQIKKLTSDWLQPPDLLLPKSDAAQTERRKSALYQLSELAIATSGTVALELAAQNCPMIVAYQANWMTTRMVKKLAQIDTANLVNIVTETRDIPELLFEQATAENIKNELDTLLNSKQAIDLQRSRMKATMAALAGRGEFKRVSAGKSVIAFLDS